MVLEIGILFFLMKLYMNAIYCLFIAKEITMAMKQLGGNNK
jgi:hypothetical protein